MAVVNMNANLITILLFCPMYFSYHQAKCAYHHEHFPFSFIISIIDLKFPVTYWIAYMCLFPSHLKVKVELLPKKIKNFQSCFPLHWVRCFYFIPPLISMPSYHILMLLYSLFDWGYIEWSFLCSTLTPCIFNSNEIKS